MRRCFSALLAALVLGSLADARPGQTVSFCDPTPNSTGQPGVMAFLGHPTAGNPLLRFGAAQLPGRSFAIVAMSYGQVGGYPFGNGTLCLNPWDLHRVSRPMLVPRHGTLEFLTELPAPALPGQWHYFQVIYRDDVGAGFNLSGGVALQVLAP